MKVVLLENITSLGKKGEIKHVSDGYAMNYLFPQYKALPATTQNIAQYSGNKADDEARLKEQLNEYNQIKNKLDGQTINFTGKVSENNVLYQGISVATIIDAIRERYNLEVHDNWFGSTAVIKEVGKNELALNLPSGVKIKLFINIKAQ